MFLISVHESAVKQIDKNLYTAFAIPITLLTQFKVVYLNDRLSCEYFFFRRKDVMHMHADFLSLVSGIVLG